MTVDPGQFVQAVSAALSQDSTVAQIEFRRANGQSAYIPFPVAAAGSMFLNIERALGQLFEMQRAALRGQDPRTFFAIGAKKVAAIQGAVAQGKPVISFVLESKIRLDLALEQTQVRELVEWLEELERGLDKPQSPGN
jgi:hypothetical protein